MKATVYVEPKFCLTISPETLAVLEKCASLHYDSTCKATTEQGGLLFGWHNCVHEFETDCSASFRELDLTTKICEVSSYGASSFNDEELALIREYQKFVHLLLTTANEKLKDAHFEVPEKPVEETTS